MSEKYETDVSLGFIYLFLLIKIDSSGNAQILPLSFPIFSNRLPKSIEIYVFRDQITQNNEVLR